MQLLLLLVGDHTLRTATPVFEAPGLGHQAGAQGATCGRPCSKMPARHEGEAVPCRILP